MKGKSFSRGNRSRGTKSNVPLLNESTQLKAKRNHPPIIKEQVDKQKGEGVQEGFKILLVVVASMFILVILFALIVIATGWKVDTSLLKVLLTVVQTTVEAAMTGGGVLLLKGKGGSDP